VLGVHFPQDVIGGWLIGLVVLVTFIWAEPPVSRWLAAQKTALQVVLAVGVPILLIFLHPTSVAGFYPAQAAITPMSALAGFGLGLIMEQRWVRFRVDGAWWRRGLRYLIGLLLVAVFYVGLRMILPAEMAHSLEAGLRFVRYALVGWATTFLAPWLFVKLRLAEQSMP
jgi:hypothetical protein